MENPASQGAAAGCKPLTTFVQTDTNTFREVVQRLTGDAAASQERVAGVKRQTCKLHERRQHTRPKLEIVKPRIYFKPAAGSSPSASPVGTPCTIFSKLSVMEEEKAIKERQFYLHPSPRSRPGYAEPELLTLFPLTSPRASENP